MSFVKWIDSLMKSHYHSVTGKVQCTESMSSCKFHQSLRRKWEVVSSRSSKFWSMPASITWKTKSHSSLPTVDKIIKLRLLYHVWTLLQCKTPRMCWMLLHMYINIVPSLDLNSYKNIYNWKPLQNLSLLICSLVHVFNLRVRLDCQMYF